MMAMQDTPRAAQWPYDAACTSLCACLAPATSARAPSSRGAMLAANLGLRGIADRSATAAIAGVCDWQYSQRDFKGAVFCVATVL